MSINVTFDAQRKDIIIFNNKQQISVNLSTLNLGVDYFDMQKKMRFADSRKDCLNVSGTKVKDIQFLDQLLANVYNTKIDSSNVTAHINYIHDLTDNVSVLNSNLIQSRTFLKSDTISSAYYDIKICMAESGLGVDKWAKKRQPGDEIIILGTLAASIDPAPRVFPNAIWTTPTGTSCSFDTNILSNVFGFPAGTNWKSTSIDTDKFKYEICVGNSNCVSGNANFKTVDGNNEKYIKGNDTKNRYLNVDAMRNPNLNTNLDILRYIILKEMGDVMQVLQFFVWCNINAGEGKPYAFDDVLIYTTDGVVYTLCQMLKIPVLYTGQPSGKSGFCKAYQYIPTEVDYSVIISKTITQAYERIFSHNSNIKFTLNKMRIEVNLLNYIDDTRRAPRLVPCNVSRNPQLKDTFLNIITEYTTNIDSINNTANTYKNTEISRITNLFNNGTSIEEINSQMNVTCNYILTTYLHPIIFVTEYAATDSLADKPRQSKIVRSYTLTGSLLEQFKTLTLNNPSRGGAIAPTRNQPAVYKSIQSFGKPRPIPKTMVSEIIKTRGLNDILNNNIGIGYFEFLTIKILYRTVQEVFRETGATEETDGIENSIIDILPLIYSQFVFFISQNDYVTFETTESLDLFVAFLMINSISMFLPSLSNADLQEKIKTIIISIKKEEENAYEEKSLYDDFGILTENDRVIINIIGLAGFKFATPDDDLEAKNSAIQPLQALQILGTRAAEIFPSQFTNPFSFNNNNSSAVSGGITSNKKKTNKRKKRKTQKNKTNKEKNLKKV